MAQALANFSIESDSIVRLSFADGTNRRVRPSQLPQYVQGQDLAKVKRALHLRRNFIRRVLPPGVMALLLSGVVILGAYDVEHMSAILHSSVAPSAYVSGGQQPVAGSATRSVSQQGALAPASSVAPQPSGDAAPNSLVQAISNDLQKIGFKPAKAQTHKHAAKSQLNHD